MLVPCTNALGRNREAEVEFRACLKECRAHGSASGLFAAQVKTSLGAVLGKRPETALEAESLQRSALATYESEFGPEHYEVGRACGELGLILIGLQRFEDAQVFLERDLTIAERQGAESRAHGEALHRAGFLHLQLAMRTPGDDKQRLLRQAIQESDAAFRIRSRFGPGADALETKNNLVLAHLQRKDPEVALPLAREVFDETTKRFGEDHERRAIAATNLAMAHQGRAFLPNKAEPSVRGDLDEAQKYYELSVSIKEQIHPKGSASIGLSCHNLAAFLVQARKGDEAWEPAERALELSRRYLYPGHPQLTRALDLMSILSLGRNDAGLVERYSAEIVSIEDSKLVGPELRAAHLALLGWSRIERERFADAEDALRECISIRERIMPGSWLAFNAMSMLAESLCGQSRFKDAEPFAVRGFEGIRSADGAPRERTRQCLARLIMLYESWVDYPLRAEKLEHLRTILEEK